MDQGSLLKVHTSFVRSVLEYTVPVWQSIPGYLSDKIESIQKRALKIISHVLIATQMPLS